VDGCDRRLQRVGSGTARRERTLEQRETFTDLRPVPAVPILHLEEHDLWRPKSVDAVPRRTDTSPRVTDAHDPGFRVERVDLQDGRSELRFGGQLRFRQCFSSWQSVRRLARPPAAHLAFDLSAVDTLDGAATALLLE